jgi:hypothetical protein
MRTRYRAWQSPAVSTGTRNSKSSYDEYGWACAEVEVHAGSAQQRPADPDVLRERGRDDADPLGAHREERVVVEHRLVLAEPLLDQIDRGPALRRPAVGMS